jgi:hypothetical protein
VAGVGLASCSKVQRPPSLPMSGNERRCSICSSENIRAATATTPTMHGQDRTRRDQHPSAERT